MAKFVRARQLIRAFKQAATPTVLEGLNVDDTWVDTDDHTFYVCTSISPVTFEEVGGGGGTSFDPSTTFEFFTDLDGSAANTNDIITASAASGAAIADSDTWATTAHYGVWRLNTGTSNSSTATISRGDATFANQFLGGGEMILEAVVQIPAILGNAASNEYTLWVGWAAHLTQPNTATNYCGIAYNYSVNSGNWQGRARKASGTEVVSNGNTGVVVDTWYKLKVVINAAGTSARFYVNGVELAGGAINTDIPDTVRVWPMVCLRSGASSTTTKNAQVDYIWIKKTFSTPR